MSRENQDNKTTEEKLTKMEHILAGHKKRRKVLGRLIKRATARLEGAVKEAEKAAESGTKDPQKETLKRRFSFDVEQLREQYTEVAGKEAWAARMVNSLRAKQVISDEGNLIHRPFAGLKMKLG